MVVCTVGNERRFKLQVIHQFYMCCFVRRRASHMRTFSGQKLRKEKCAEGIQRSKTPNQTNRYNIYRPQ